jgi:hypothetical protein
MIKITMDCETQVEARAVLEALQLRRFLMGVIEQDLLDAATRGSQFRHPGAALESTIGCRDKWEERLADAGITCIRGR